jgi:cbb3-type cytochrome oxidase maturation protein
MSVIYVVLPVALLIAAAAVAAFVWAVRTGQLDDMETPAMRMLHDDVAAGSSAAGSSASDPADGDANGKRRA